MVILISASLIMIIFQATRLGIVLKKRRGINNSLLKREKEMAYLNSVLSFAVAGKEDIGGLLCSLLNNLRDTFNWTYHSIFRLDEDRQVLIIRFTGYLPSWYMEQFSSKIQVKVGDISVGRAVATKQPITINSAAVDPRFSSVASLTKTVAFKSLLCCPMIGKLKTYGGFCTYDTRENIFSLHDSQFLMTCANIFTVTLEDTFLTDYLEKKSRKTEKDQTHLRQTQKIAK